MYSVPVCWLMEADAPCCSLLSAGLCAKMNEEDLARLENATVHVMVSVCVRGSLVLALYYLWF